VLYLRGDTHSDFVAEAASQLDELLIDHAHCEKKAASTALTLLFRYPDVAALQAPLSALAREELEHFELMLATCESRGITFGRLTPSAYAGRLVQAARTEEPGRLVDALLCCALIEARSCERMKLLASGLPDADLRALYSGLLASEARHHALYVDLAAGLVGRDQARARLDTLAAHEAEVIAEPSTRLRMHSGPLVGPPA
jgi:tRNA-(ms[2]io[6]A)-hydroxylase